MISPMVCDPSILGSILKGIVSVCSFAHGTKRGERILSSQVQDARWWVEERLPHDKQQKEHPPLEYDWAGWAEDTRQGGFFGCFRKAQNTMGEISNSMVPMQRRWSQHETPVPDSRGLYGAKRQMNVISFNAAWSYLWLFYNPRFDSPKAFLRRMDDRDRHFIHVQIAVDDAESVLFATPKATCMTR